MADLSGAEGAALERLRQIVARLRAPDGCAWDREQTHASLRGGLIEEAYETVEAIDNRDDAHFREELGDLLLQVVMHSQIASEERRFDLDEVAAGVGEKLVRRHPHVFGDESAADSEAVLQKWDEIKRAERESKGDGAPSALDGVSAALPALMRAEKVQKRAARVGFDWPDAQGALAKVREELAEVEQALGCDSKTALEEELGDLLFAVVNLTRKVGMEAELVLAKATSKFVRRFQLVEGEVQSRNLRMEHLSLDELDRVWEAVKAALRAENAR